jgi:hypothetical protein
MLVKGVGSFVLLVAMAGVGAVIGFRGSFDGMLPEPASYGVGIANVDPAACVTPTATPAAAPPGSGFGSDADDAPICIQGSKARFE